MDPPIPRTTNKPTSTTAEPARRGGDPAHPDQAHGAGPRLLPAGRNRGGSHPACSGGGGDDLAAAWVGTGVVGGGASGPADPAGDGGREFVPALLRVVPLGVKGIYVSGSIYSNGLRNVRHENVVVASHCLFCK